MPAGEDVAAAKVRLRGELLAARRALAPAEIAAARASVRERILDRAGHAADGGRPWRVALAYEPLRTEPGSTELLDGLTERDIAVFVPVRLADNDLDWVGWPDRSPARRPDVEGSASVVLVPALAVDHAGHRLGRGGGSYDRVLARVGTGVPIVALLYDSEVVNEVPTEPWDRPVTATVTPRGWFGLGQPERG